MKTKDAFAVLRSFAILSLLFILLGGCEKSLVGSVYAPTPSSADVKTGEGLQLTVNQYPELSGGGGCITSGRGPGEIDRSQKQSQDPSLFSWIVEPEGAAVDDNGLFKASNPGKYRVTLMAKTGFKPIHPSVKFLSSEITVTEKGAGKAQEKEDETRFMEDRPDGNPIEIFKIGNLLAVFNGGTSPTIQLKREFYFTEITTYHWNGGKGTPAGTIAMKDSTGKIYGPWKASLVNGVYWLARPERIIPAGTYTIIDSDPSTWAQNPDSGGKGMAWASGIPVN